MILLDGMIFSEQEFYQQQYNNDRKWGRAITLVVIFHVLIFAAAKYLPEIMHRDPLIEDVMTIDLVSMPEPQSVKVQPPEPVARQQQPAPAPQPVAKAPEPPKAAPIEVADSPEPEPVPVPDAKPISIRPLKRKIKKARDTRLEEEKRREKLAILQKRRQQEQLALERRRRQQARRARKKALARAKFEEQRARNAARNARAEIAAVLREQQRLRNARPAGGQGRRSRSIHSALEKQYYMDVASRVQRLWVLPEIKKWSPALETIIEFTVLGDGHLANVKVANSSGDSFFDSFARETVKKAAPMPPIPPVLKKNHLDFGFRLRPAGVQN